MSDPASLISNYLDGPLTPENQAALNAWLEQDPVNMSRFTEELLFEQQLRSAVEAELGQAATAVFPLDPPSAIATHRPWFRPRNLLLAAAAVVLFASLFAIAFRHQTGGGEIVTVQEISGMLSWSGQDGEMRNRVSPGEHISSGTFETQGEDSRAVLLFKDGTRLTLGSETRASISESGRKQVHLQSGNLRADVTPQPKGDAMRVRTATANLEVLGTLFSLTAAGERTTMNVERGLVRMERLADGGTVEVPANHMVAASLETRMPLKALRNTMPAATWQLAPAAASTMEIRGIWQQSTQSFTAVPILVGRDPETDRMLIQHGIGLRDPSLPNCGSFVTVASDGVLHFRYRTAKPSPVVIFFVTQYPGGNFGGNFEINLPENSGKPLADGWREISVPLASIPPVNPEVARQPVGNGISSLGIRTYREEAHLEISGLSIHSRAR